ncbi:cellulase [Streptomyces sp. NPDC001100]
MDQMDPFERQLARLMRDTHEPVPFEPRHRERLHEGVRVRRRTRMVRRTVGCALAVVGVGIGLLLVPAGPTRVQPAEPHPRPATSPTSTGSAPTPGETPTAPPTSSATTSLANPGATTSDTPTGPTTTGSSATVTATTQKNKGVAA